MAKSSAAALQEVIAALSGGPDDGSDVDALLAQLVSLVAALVESVDYASVTAERDGAATTVATSSEVASAVDEAQYADRSDPGLDAHAEETPIAAGSFSIPLIAGRGSPVAVLNLYARETSGLVPLILAVNAVFVRSAEQPLSEADVRQLTDTLDEGSAQLVTGIAEAFAVQRENHVAIGILCELRQVSADRAYIMLARASCEHI